jgi:hypothetical protein
MKKTSKKNRYIACIVLIIIVSAGIGLFLRGCKTTRIYNIPYDKAESMLLSRLSLDKEVFIHKTQSVQAKADDMLAKSMRMRLYAVRLYWYRPSEGLIFACYHRYDIGATGREYIRFDLEKISAEKTRITVDYCDRWRGILPPFLFYNPGPFREKEIHKAIWGSEDSKD